MNLIKRVQHGRFFVRTIIGFKIIKAFFETSGLLLKQFICLSQKHLLHSFHNVSVWRLLLWIPNVQPQSPWRQQYLFIYLAFFQKDLKSKRGARDTKW